MNMPDRFTPTTSPFIGMMSAYNPKIKLMTDTSMEDNAYFSSGKPNYLFTSSNKQEYFPHEFGHMMDYRALQRYAPNRTVDELTKATETKKHPKGFNIQGSALGSFMAKSLSESGVENPVLKLRDFMDSFDNPEVQKRFKELFPSMTETNRIAGKERSIEELIVDLNAFETLYNKDITQDPTLLKELFGNSSALIEAYKASRPERSDRLDAKDLPPFQTQYSGEGIKPSIKAWWNNTLRDIGF